MTEKLQIPNRLQLKLSNRHRDLLQHVMEDLQITKQEAINRAIEGLAKMAKMQRKLEKEKALTE